MSVNVGSIAVGMNVDLATFQTGLQRATRLASSETGLMSAEMKRQSREGAESMRLIDEAIGVHISRPLTRVIAQLPGIGTALGALGGIGGLAGIIALVGVGFEKLEPTFEHLGKEIGLVSDSIDDVAKSMSRSNKDIIAQMERKISLEEAYRKLVLGETGSKLDADRTKELQKQSDILLQQFFSEKARLQLKASELTFLEKIGDTIKKQGGFYAGFGDLSIFDQSAKRFDEYKKALEGINPLLEKSKALADEATKAGFEGVRDRREEEKQRIKNLQEELKEWNREANKSFEEWIKLNGEIDKGVEKLKEISLLEFNKRFTEQRKEFAPYFDQPVKPPAGPPPTRDQEELIAIQRDENEARRKAAEILSEIEPAEQKYLVTKQTLEFLQSKGLITKEQEHQAMIKANDDLLLATDRLRRLTEELQRALEHSTSARAGFRAFFLQLQIDASQNGKFAFDILSNSLRGFEDNLASMLVRGRAYWREYFQSIEEQAVKFALNKTIASIFSQIGSTGIGKAIGGALGGTANAAGGATLQAAGTTLLTAGTTLTSSSITLQTAAATLLSAASTLGASSAGGGGFGALLDLIPHAGGGDVTPGNAYLVGEEGPEILTLGAGGASGYITPNSQTGSSGGGGGKTIINIDNRGADAGAEQRMLRLIRSSEERAVARAVTIMHESSNRRPR